MESIIPELKADTFKVTNLIIIKNNYHCYVHHRCHRNNKSIEQNIEFISSFILL